MRRSHNIVLLLASLASLCTAQRIPPQFEQPSSGFDLPPEYQGGGLGSGDFGPPRIYLAAGGGRLPARTFPSLPAGGLGLTLPPEFSEWFSQLGVAAPGAVEESGAVEEVDVAAPPPAAPGAAALRAALRAYRAGAYGTVGRPAVAYGGYDVPTPPPAPVAYGGYGVAAPPPAPVAYRGYGVAAPPPAPVAYGGYGVAAPPPAPVAYGGYGVAAPPSPVAYGGYGVAAPPPAPVAYGGFGVAAPPPAPVAYGQ